MNELALFAGAGGGILAGKTLGWRTVCAVERDAYAAGILAQRQNDGTLAPFPIWSDITTFDGGRWRGVVDVVSGGFPCQDISCAGTGAGLDGERSGLWREMARIIREVRPRFVFVENSPILTSRGLGRVLGDLAEMGFNAEWGVLGAADVGAAHLRERIWVVAYAVRFGLPRWENNRGGRASAERPEKQLPGFLPPDRWLEISKSGGFGEPDGLAYRVDRSKAIGNGQVPQCAAEAWNRLLARI